MLAYPQVILNVLIRHLLSGFDLRGFGRRQGLHRVVKFSSIDGEQVRQAMTVFFIALETGLALGAIYVLVALSFTLVLAVSGVFNFLLGSSVMIATVLSFILAVEHGWPILGVISAIVFFGFLAGLVTHTLAVRPVLARSKNIVETTLLATLGAATAVNAAVALAFGSEPRPVPGYVSAQPWQLGSLPINKTYFVIVVVTFGIGFGFDQFLRRTDTGRVIRVTLEDPEGARTLGVDTARITLVSFAVAGGLAALAGWLVAPVILASPYSSAPLTFYAFAGMAIGGFGSFAGATFGGVVVGLTVGFIPAYLNPDWVNPTVLVLTTVILLVRPHGLLGTAGLFGATRLREL